MKGIKTYLTIGALWLLAINAYSQEFSNFPQFDLRTEKFESIKVKVQQYIDEKIATEYGSVVTGPEQKSENELVHLYRWLREMENHVSADGYVRNYSAYNFEAFLKVKEEAQNKNGGPNSVAASTGGSWSAKYMNSTPNGANISQRWGHGRIECMALDPYNANIYYAGCFMGGLWKSTDAGVNWYNISNGIPEPSVSAIAINPSNTSNIFIFSGVAGNNFITGMQTTSLGVFVTYDGGNNWFSTGLTFTPDSNAVGFSLKIAPTNNSILVAATNKGIYRSTNGGGSWTFVQAGAFYDIEFKPGSSTCYAGSASDIWISTNNGGVWTKVASTAYSSGKPVGTNIVDLAVSPANVNYVYAFFQGGAVCKVERSFNSGATWDEKSDVTTIAGGLGMNYQSGYGYGIAVSETNVGTLYLGDAEIIKSTDFGATWTIVANYWWNIPTNVHEDTHDLICRGGSEVFVATDGGVFRSDDAGATWDFLSHRLNTAGYYGFGGTSADPNFFVGGSWDNGHFKLSGTTLTHLTCCDQGDGMVDPTNANRFYVSGIWFSSPLSRTTDGGSSFTNITASNGCNCPDTLTSSSEKVMQTNPLNANTIYSMYRDFYVSYNKGTTWSRKIIGGITTQAFAQGTNDTARFYAVKATNIMGSTNSGSTWSTIYTHPYAEKIWEITVNASNKNEFYFVCTGYNGNNHVWKGTWPGTGLATATNLSAGLANVPCYKVLYQTTSSPGIYVGTDIGVFFRGNATGNWELFSNGLPFCRVMDMEINYGSNKISCATYGRGIWQSDLYNGCPYSFDHGNYYIFGIPFAYPTVMGSEYFEASNNIHSSVIIQGGFGTDVTYNSGNYVLLTDTFEVKSGTTFRAYIQGCTIPEPVPALQGEYAGSLKEDNPYNTTSPTRGYDFYLSLIPNPANTGVSVNYSIARDADVNLQLLDLSGRVIRNLQQESMVRAGYYKLPVDLADINNGVYFVRIISEGKSILSKLVVAH